jgi:hypothetical protein
MSVRPDLPPMPPRVARLPLDERGYPVPYFVAWVDGKPDHRIADPLKFAAALVARRCWVCGDVLGVNLAFLIGPMCAINRVSAEPPMHVECAEWAVRACPFMSRPRMMRRTSELPDQITISDHHIDRNPGVMLLWVAREYYPEQVDAKTVLFMLGNPTIVKAYSEGRLADGGEIVQSIVSGLPNLVEPARAEGVIEDLNKRVKITATLLGVSLPEVA